MKKIAILASGSGSNAENIVRYFSNRENLNIECIYSNKADAYVLERAKNLGVPSMVFNRDDFYNSEKIVDRLKSQGVDLVVLAGFLWLIPKNMTDNFRIVNIHPALLPAYGGKGMYGHFVHDAVVRNKEPESGITIHWVNENYDEGQIIFQAKCPVLPTDTADDVAQKVHELEYQYFPKIIDEILFGSRS